MKIHMPKQNLGFIGISLGSVFYVDIRGFNVYIRIKNRRWSIADGKLAAWR